MSALAALGKWAEVQTLWDSVGSSPEERGFWAGQLLSVAAEEFRAHGHEEAATEALAAAIKWFESRDGADTARVTYRVEKGRALYLARDWTAAERVFRALAAQDSTNPMYLGFLGTIAARRGDRQTAESIVARLDALRSRLARPRETIGFWQAKIAVLLGQNDRAMTLAADALGSQGRGALHSDSDFERIWGTKEFREFIRPKG